ncbi:class I SAM-dependent methyltransferase [Actinocorallia sp. A-T 12471]|uniref:class I SAM-dependent methyltransferase n=1 Tax=Actinocorallia sp. A-T 12471 TaxID=3089813 RepID=UPI0029CB80CB|nr:class I SAM-dependent methyltransferase [Actinocorallia sp. A-T 12471]MDX6738522.1 class I SAM-dependent methyltransferase [Actinocorallia sp. A-T 12471]
MTELSVKASVANTSGSGPTSQGSGTQALQGGDRPGPAPEADLFAERVRLHALDKGLTKIHVLEAGCGRGPGLALPDGIARHVTGIDVDAPALRTGTMARADLDVYHLGDLRRAPLPPRSFDVVHADALIERIAHAELVMDRMVAALKPGGLLLVRFIDRDSAQGLLRRALPRRALGLLGVAGSRGETPRESPAAVFEPVSSLAGFRSWCLMRGLVIAEAHVHRVPASTPARVLARLIAIATHGRFTSGHAELSLVIRKPENRFARII